MWDRVPALAPVPFLIFLLHRRVIPAALHGRIDERPAICPAWFCLYKSGNV